MKKRMPIILLVITLFLAFVVLASLALSRKGIVKNIPIPFASPNESSQPVPLSSNPNEIRTGGGQESEQFQQEERNFILQHPILQLLPADDPNFSIDYVNEKHLIVRPKINDQERAYQAAKNWFVKNNIDITNINIEYK